MKSYSTGNGQPGSSELNEGAESQAAVNLIRQKIARLYAEEPDVAEELAEAESAPRRSKHQQFMHELSSSGKDLANIQTEWHNYYQGLTDTAKHEVWQEFYASQPRLTGQPRHGGPAKAQLLAQHKHEAAKPRASRKLRDARSTAEIQAAIKHKVSAGGKLKAKHHLQSLLFGLGMGLVVLLIFLFGFFNEVVVAPFIQPSRVSGDAPLIINSNSVATTSSPEVIIPKINVQIPVNYSETSTDENAIENDLQDGVVHYPTTVLPGQIGNAAFFGHSSNNIFNKGKYKFAFVLLHTLVPGDTFYLSYNGTMYVYKVVSRNIVEPNNVGVLGAVPGQKATATLITCDPPGTSLHRLIVVGQQISPDPSGNTAPAVAAPIQPASLPGNGPTLWGRFISTLIGKIITLAVLVAAGWFIIRWVNRRVDELV
ncbi:MAG TPA: class E sortase [Candidatus Dormibacteraeota bacterium]|nr:class E sortase [Candidatus Dormibacteraeota bacterium]